MALAEAILVCLTERPMSGYDLAKYFDASIGYFWRASHQQIYRELGRLREREMIQSQEISQSGKPNRIVHTITDKGRSAVRTWSSKPVRMPSIKDELLVKLYAMETVDTRAMREQISVRLEQHHSKLIAFKRIQERHYAGKNLSLNQKGKLFALEMGMEEEINRIAGWERILEKMTKAGV